MQDFVRFEDGWGYSAYLLKGEVRSKRRAVRGVSSKAVGEGAGPWRRDTLCGISRGVKRAVRETLNLR